MERASDAGRRLKELGTVIEERASDTARSTRRMSEDYTGRLRDRVVDYPLASIGVAVVVGAFISVLLARR
ncbi:MAG: hypothetical protein H0V62_08960 [Gammaproteobacteria bacterium]|nr:hypothetical protein [Gammaproteobacteria bacterium]